MENRGLFDGGGLYRYAGLSLVRMKEQQQEKKKTEKRKEEGDENRGLVEGGVCTKFDS